MKKFILILVSLIWLFLAGGLRAWADYDETLKSVEENIAGFKERKAALVTQQKELVKQFQANPSLDVYRQIEKLRGDMKTIERHIRSCSAALVVAQLAGSYSGMLQEMSKDSNLLYAGLNVISSVASAGKWIFGVSNEDLYGSSWQEAESYSKNIIAEARAIREESQDILKALDQVNAILQANGSSEEMVTLS